ARRAAEQQEQQANNQPTPTPAGPRISGTPQTATPGSPAPTATPTPYTSPTPAASPSPSPRAAPSPSAPPAPRVTPPPAPPPLPQNLSLTLAPGVNEFGYSGPAVPLLTLLAPVAGKYSSVVYKVPGGVWVQYQPGAAGAGGNALLVLPGSQVSIIMTE